MLLQREYFYVLNRTEIYQIIALGITELQLDMGNDIIRSVIEWILLEFQSIALHPDSNNSSQ